MDKNYNMGGRHHIFERPGSDIKMTGYLRKLKTMKKKFFVLRSTSSSGPARLEYYDNEKKFQSGSLPKRSIHLHTCFNINKRTDSRTGRFGIVLYTVPDSFTVLTESETDQEAWLDVMLEYQNEYLPDGDVGKEHYEHVWQVTMQAKGLGQGKGLKGQYRMCLNSTTISLFKVNANKPQFSTQLVTVRAVGHNDNNFWLQLGNYSSTGPGEFWFLVEDSAVADDMHKTIVQYMASVKDFLDKDQQFAISKKAISSGFMDSFGGVSQHYGDSRKSYTSSGTYPNDASFDFTTDYYSMKQSNGLSDFSHPQCSSDFDGESSCYYDGSLADHQPALSHHSLVCTHSGGKHSYNFTEHLHPTHLPTVKEGGSGEGYLLSELPPSETSSMDFPRPEPATCLLSDEPVDLPPRTYSLGSRPPKKFQGFPEVSSRKTAGNEISRATSAPHIPKGRKEREHKRDSPSPAPSPLSTSMKSDDSDSMIEYGPIRPRTASDSFNYRSRTSSFGKPQQNCRPRSSSYGQGKRPTINVTKLKLEKLVLSGNGSQRTSRESSLQSSFESLRVSSESLRRPSLELWQPSLELRQQPRVIYSSDQNELRNTPSPQLMNLPSDSESFNDLSTGVHKNAPFMRTEINTSGRPPELMARRSEHHHQPQSHLTHDHSRVMTSGACNEDVYANIDFGTQPTSSHDNKPLPSASYGQQSRVETSKYMNIDLGSRNRRPHGARSVSVENVDTYFISDLPFTVNKLRTGSVGSKDKQMLRPESARKSIPVPACSTVPSYFVATSSVQSSSSVPSCSQCINQQSLPLASMSSHSFSGNDSVRRLPGVPSSEKHGMPDFRQKSGSTGSRPNMMKSSLGMASGKEHRLSSAVRVRKSSLPRFTDDDEYIDFLPLSLSCDSRTGCRDSSDVTQPSSVFPGNTDANINHFSMAQSGMKLSISQSGTEPSISQSSTESHSTQSGTESRSTQSGTEQSISQSGKESCSEINLSGTSHSYLPLAQKDQTDPAASSQSVTSASPSSSSSSLCRVTSQPPTSSAKDEESYIPYNPLQEPLHTLLHHHYCTQKFNKAEAIAPMPPWPQISQGQKPKHVALDHAQSKLVSASSGVPTSGHDAAQTQYLNGYVEYEPGSVSCESLILSPDSALSHVDTCRSSGTVCLAKLKQHQTCLNVDTPARKSLSHTAVADADLCHCHHNTSDNPWGTDPESLSEQTCQHCFHPVKAQSLEKTSTSEHRHLNSSVEVNGLPPTGLEPKHHVHNCDDSVSCGSCIESLSKESCHLSSSPASGTNKCQQTCIDHPSDISSAADSMTFSESFDITHGSAPSVVDSMKSTAISRHAQHSRHSLSDITSVTGTTGRVCENNLPGTGNISVVDNLPVHRKSGFRRSLTDCDLLDLSSQLTSHN